jgi:CDP-paratose 2-epimerase
MEKNREGDHICYISDLSKIQEHFPNWKITKSLDSILSEITDSWKKRIKIDCN